MHMEAVMKKSPVRKAHSDTNVARTKGEREVLAMYRRLKAAHRTYGQSMVQWSRALCQMAGVR